MKKINFSKIFLFLLLSFYFGGILDSYFKGQCVNMKGSAVLCGNDLLIFLALCGLSALFYFLPNLDRVLIEGDQVDKERKIEIRESIIATVIFLFVLILSYEDYRGDGCISYGFQNLCLGKWLLYVLLLITVLLALIPFIGEKQSDIFKRFFKHLYKWKSFYSGLLFILVSWIDFQRYSSGHCVDFHKIGLPPVCGRSLFTLSLLEFIFGFILAVITIKEIQKKESKAKK